jgi:hypothetical protein
MRFGAMPISNSLGALLAVLVVPLGGCATTPVVGTPVPAGRESPAVAEETRVFVGPVLEEGVFDVLENLYHIKNIDSVHCPDDEEVRVGHKFSCVATINGVAREVIITVRSEDGEYEVSQPE